MSSPQCLGGPPATTWIADREAAVRGPNPLQVRMQDERPVPRFSGAALCGMRAPSWTLPGNAVCRSVRLSPADRSHRPTGPFTGKRVRSSGSGRESTVAEKVSRERPERPPSRRERAFVRGGPSRTSGLSADGSYVPRELVVRTAGFLDQRQRDRLRVTIRYSGEGVVAPSGVTEAVRPRA